MRYGIGLLALLLGATDASAQDPLDTALRDAQQLAECMKALDAACVTALSDIKSYQLLSPAGVDFSKHQTHFFDKLRERGWGWTRYEVAAPSEVFHDGTRLYAFVPTVSTSTVGGQPHTTRSFDVALSVDGGETWKFVGINKPEQIRHIIPSYFGQPLPPTGEVEPLTIGLGNVNPAATPALRNPMDDWSALNVHLGVRLGPVSDEEAGGEIPRGARVLEVFPGSVALRAGIRANDIIVKFDAQDINMPLDVRKFIVPKNPGDTVDVVILRDDTKITVSAQF